VNDAISQTGSFSLAFNHGFPIDESLEEEEHLAVAPHILLDWETPTPNYEKVILEYRWNGKLYSSATPLNNIPNSILELIGHAPFSAGLQGQSAITSEVRFSAKLIEVGNESNVLEFENCSGTFGFIIPN